MGIKVTGTEKIEARLKKMIVSNMIKAALQNAAEAGGEVLLAEAETHVDNPADLGMHFVKRSKKKAVLDIGPKRKKWFLRFLETGAIRHEIKGSPLSFEAKSGDQVATRIVEHPGMPAKPFLRPAFDTKSDAAAKATGEAFWDTLMKQE